MGATRATLLRADLAACVDVDAAARVVLVGLLAVPGVVRTGIALVAPGGRQLHFLPSDPHRLRDQPEWCLIDAYDDLPLNDCIRRDEPVVHGRPEAMARSYPGLARAQEGTGVRSVCALPLARGSDRLGGLLVYLDADLPEGGGEVLATLLDLAEVVVHTLWRLRPADDWPVGEPAVGRDVDDAEECPLSADATAPSVARRWLADALDRLRVTGAAVDAALVCASELVTNVVMHTGRPSVLRVSRDGAEVTLRLRHVTDPTPRKIVRTDHDDPLRISGHGLELVDALSTSWGTEERDGVTTTWCRLPIAATSL
jgi:anti-sigma regulatory factor (Ser/Thr protein kinase)